MTGASASWSEFWILNWQDKAAVVLDLWSCPTMFMPFSGFLKKDNLVFL